MWKRMAVAVLSMVGLFISAYLLLFKLGVYGELACGTGSCETVQASEYATFLGLPVAGWGVVWYAGVFALAFLSTQAAFSEARWPPLALLVLATGGLAFSGYLTYVELFVIYAVCMWCVVSALITAAIFILAMPGRTREAA